MRKAIPTTPKIEEQASAQGFGRLFVSLLIKWNEEQNDREMPWKGEKNPYRVWLSEIILQQTRVEQGLAYYHRFVSAFPDVHALALAPETDVMKLWEGLGYYSRCRNLIHTARHISRDLGGRFPADYHSIIKLKGIGPYTAAAISSFAFDLPHAVLDGNVYRVLSRIFNIHTPIDSPHGKKTFTRLAGELLPKHKAAAYNQAIMDFGAVICKPVPVCSKCFFREYCKAYLSGQQNMLPVKEKKLAVKKRWLNYFVVTCKGKIAIHKRSGNDIWQNLYEFILIESTGPLDENTLLADFADQFAVSIRETGDAKIIEQRLTHQLIRFCFIPIEVAQPVASENLIWITLEELEKFPFPKSLQQFLQYSF